MSQYKSFSLIHPSHFEYLNTYPLAPLAKLFDLLDEIDPEQREKILWYAQHAIIKPRYRNAATGNETLQELMIDEVSYDIFKTKCYFIAERLDEAFLVFSIVSFTLQKVFKLGDVTRLGEVENNHKRLIQIHEEYLELPEDELPEEFKRRGGKKAVEEFLKFARKLAAGVEDGTKASYSLYELFCDKVVSKLVDFYNEAVPRIK
jgi:hypothetical protein